MKMETNKKDVYERPAAAVIKMEPLMQTTASGNAGTGKIGTGPSTEAKGNSFFFGEEETERDNQ